MHTLMPQKSFLTQSVDVEKIGVYDGGTMITSLSFLSKW